MISARPASRGGRRRYRPRRDPAHDAPARRLPHARDTRITSRRRQGCAGADGLRTRFADGAATRSASRPASRRPRRGIYADVFPNLPRLLRARRARNRAAPSRDLHRVATATTTQTSRSRRGELHDPTAHVASAQRRARDAIRRSHIESPVRAPAARGRSQRTSRRSAGPCAPGHGDLRRHGGTHSPGAYLGGLQPGGSTAALGCTSRLEAFSGNVRKSQPLLARVYATEQILWRQTEKIIRCAATVASLWFNGPASRDACGWDDGQGSEALGR